MFAVCSEAYKTTVSRNANMAKLQAGYLFPEVGDVMCSYLPYCYTLAVANSVIGPMIDIMVHHFFWGPISWLSVHTRFNSSCMASPPLVLTQPTKGLCFVSYTDF
jgi:hypothetical protein